MIWKEILAKLGDPWTYFGFIAQLMFTLRFVVQWIESERAKRSVVPTSFWWFSLIGSTLLLIYAIYRADPVFILAQSFGFVVYVRNLMLLKRTQTPPTAPGAKEIA